MNKRFEVAVYERVNGKASVFAEDVYAKLDIAKVWAERFMSTLPHLQGADIEVYEGKLVIEIHVLEDGMWKKSVRGLK